MKLLFLGRLADVAGQTERGVAAPADVVDARRLLDWLERDSPMLGEALRDPSVRMLVNGGLAHGNAAVSDEDEVAFFPPVSGG